MIKIPFVKMHGLGNDFVIIAEEMLPLELDRKSFAQRIPDGRLGMVVISSLLTVRAIILLK